MKSTITLPFRTPADKENAAYFLGTLNQTSTFTATIDAGDLVVVMK